MAEFTRDMPKDMIATVHKGEAVSPAARVAPIKQSTPNLRRACAELGVCQGLEPPCGLCAKHGAPDTSAHYSVGPIAYWGAVTLLSIFSAATLAGIAGYVLTKFF